MNRPALYAILLALTLLLATPFPAAAILQKGQPAPPLKVVTTSGQQVTLDNYKGHVLILDFFATWCVPCKESIPHFIELNARLGKKGLQILGMSVDEDALKEVRAFAVDHKLTYPVALANEDLQVDYSLRSVPTVYVINKKGTVAEIFRGYNSDIGRSMDALITRLLAE